MTRQEFRVTDVVRLEVQEGWPDLPNLIENPSMQGGAWGWSLSDPSQVQDGSITVTSVYVAGTRRIPIEPVTGPGIQSRGAYRDLTLAGSLTVVRNAVSAAGVNLDQRIDELPNNASVHELPAWDLPVGTTQVSVSFAGNPVGRFTDVVLMVGTAAEIAASDPLTEPPWVDVLGSTHEINTEREELNLSTLNARIYDSSLDPANNSLIRPGKRCRLRALIEGAWENLFTGLLADPSTAYQVADPRLPDGKRTQIQLVAHDPATQLANAPRPNGVATIDELPAVLLGCGVPWNVNGVTYAVDPDSVPIVAVNDSAKAIDQIAITRDSVLGYAWIDRNGVVQAWDRDQISTTVAAVLDEDDYSGLDLDFDLGRCINIVAIKHTRINPGTGETEEVDFGPYIDGPSAREWGPRRAEFRVQGVDEALLDEYAAEILTANATPAKRINRMTVPLRTLAEVEAKALLDLYDLVELHNERGGIDGDLTRVTSVKHTISATGEAGIWTIELGYSTNGSVASPQLTPSPTVGGQRTLAQLLRPVGEVTMWFGAKAGIPAGWLPLDGEEFDPAAYPVLAELLGGTVLPDFTDRMPVGAGTKALGTTGGSPTHSHTTPNHTHTDNYSIGAPVGTVSREPRTGDDNAAGTAHTHPIGGGILSSGGGATGAADSLPPWLSLWFIIRAA